MAVYREILIPYFIPQIDGHILGDPWYYHSLATTKAAEMRELGLAAFELRPSGQGPAGIGSLIYLIFENPYGFVLMNAVLHGVAVSTLALMLMQWFSIRVSILAVIPATISPYMMVWYSQLNKESFLLAGALLFLYGLTRFFNSRVSGRFVKSLLIAATGITLIWIVRPYVNQILIPVTSVVFFVALMYVARLTKMRNLICLALYGGAIFVLLALMSRGATSDETVASFKEFKSIAGQESKSVAGKAENPFANELGRVSNECLSTVSEEKWESWALFPEYLDSKLKAMMGQRCLIFSLLETHGDSLSESSFVDMDRFPGGTLEALAYLPRAFQWGVLSPWPSQWIEGFHSSSRFYLISSIEAIILYAGLIGMICWSYWEPRFWIILLPIFVSLYVMTVYGMAIPFVGALYRYRYPWWVLLMCIGLAIILEKSFKVRRRN